MRTFKAENKNGQKIMGMAMAYAGNQLTDVYANPSKAKVDAYDRCLWQCFDERGTDFHICSYNTFGFTVAWKVENGYRVETKDNSYLVLC